MILDELTLRNFGTFAGKQTITLSPPSPRKPVVLIGGLNGAGKTTILEAILLALYGSLAPVSGRRSGSYENYLRGLIHHGVPQKEGAGVELAFTAHQQGTAREYRIRRSWQSTGASIREILDVLVDGRHDAALTSTWSEHVETFLPRGIAGLFFFDGEQIEALADLERSRQVVNTALDALLGLDLVQRLTTDLAVLRRRHRSQQIPDDLRQSLEERKRAATALRQSEEVASAAVAAVRVDVERAEKRLFEATEAYRSAGGDLLQQRDSAEASVAMLRSELERIEDELRDEASDLAPLLQVAPQLSALADQARREAEAARNRGAIGLMSERDELILAKLREGKTRAGLIDSVEKFLTEDRETRRRSADEAAIVGVGDAASFEALQHTALPAVERRLRGLILRRAATQIELEQAERLLVAMPDPEALAPIAKQRDDAAAELIRAQAALKHAEERQGSVRQERERAEAALDAALDRAAHANLAAEDGRRLVDHADRVKETLEKLRIAATRRHLSRISELILEALKRLLRKESLIAAVAIDPETYTVELARTDGSQLHAQQLSAGERQLLAVALLWGLARAAGQPLPVVVDTPLGRLDRTHREHLLERYFPHASHQVVLLSTDTEIDAEAFERLQRHVGRSYRLTFDTTSNGTTVVPGYFWE
ncbi:DNA sulfur modification protein DndD [Kribbella swartbergensis]